MHYTVYKTTCKKSGKIYIGKHQTKNLNDGYFGSGKLLGYALKKYGRDNFEKELLYVFSTEEEMNCKEAELVTEEFCAREDTYNLCPGGKGGWGYVNQNGLHSYQDDNLSEQLRRKKISNALKGRRNPIFEVWLENAHKIGYFQRFENGFKGKKHSEETKRKIGKTCSLKQSGSKNSQFGTMWITNGSESKKIKKSDPIPEGFRKGRTFS